MRLLGLIAWAAAAAMVLVNAEKDVESLKIDRVKEYECANPSKTGDDLQVHYTGSLLSNGEEFDSSRNRGPPFRFTIGRGQVIEGWEVGMLGMCPGDVRKVIIPSKMAYGASGAGGVIPPNAALAFDVEMVSVNGQRREGGEEEEGSDDDVDEDYEDEETEEDEEAGDYEDDEEDYEELEEEL